MCRPAVFQTLISSEQSLMDISGYMEAIRLLESIPTITQSTVNTAAHWLIILFAILKELSPSHLINYFLIMISSLMNKYTVTPVTFTEQFQIMIFKRKSSHNNIASIARSM